MKLTGYATAAAAVLLVAGGATAGVRLLHHPASAAPATPTTPTVPVADLTTSDPAFRLGPDQVPSIAGLDARQARALLEKTGYRVRVDQRSGCADVADELGLTPHPGTILTRGSTVILREVVPSPGADCAQADHPDARVTAFLAWARGLGPMPDFADRVTVQFTTQAASGGVTRTLHGAAIAERDGWPGLSSLADVLAVPARGQAGLIPLAATRSTTTCSPAPGGTCPPMPSATIAGSAGATNVKADTDPLFAVTLELGAGDRIAAVILVDERALSRTDGPDVVGDSADFAAARLRAYGFDVTRRDVLGCAQRGQVTGTEIEGNHTTIEVSDNHASCAD